MRHERVIAYAIWPLKPHKVNYPMHDLEPAVVAFALTIWRHHLYCKTIPYTHTDHKSLKYVMGQEK